MDLFLGGRGVFFLDAGLDEFEELFVDVFGGEGGVGLVLVHPDLGGLVAHALGGDLRHHAVLGRARLVLVRHEVPRQHLGRAVDHCVHNLRRSVTIRSPESDICF